MAMTSTQMPPEGNASIARDGAPGEPAPRARQGAPLGRKLMADLSEFLTRRRQQRGGLYLPLVRVDGGE